MFDRLPSDPPHSLGDPRGSKNYYLPPGALAVATQAGRVVYARSHPNGFRVRLATDDGFEELHLHLSDLRVSAGQRVIEGQPLGAVGGDPSKYPHTYHLHYERRRNNVPENPAPYLEGAKPVRGEVLVAIAALGAFLVLS